MTAFSLYKLVALALFWYHSQGGSAKTGAVLFFFTLTAIFILDAGHTGKTISSSTPGLLAGLRQLLAGLIHFAIWPFYVLLAAAFLIVSLGSVMSGGTQALAGGNSCSYSGCGGQVAATEGPMMASAAGGCKCQSQGHAQAKGASKVQYVPVRSTPPMIPPGATRPVQRTFNSAVPTATPKPGQIQPRPAPPVTNQVRPPQQTAPVRSASPIQPEVRLPSEPAGPPAAK